MKASEQCVGSVFGEATRLSLVKNLVAAILI